MSLSLSLEQILIYVGLPLLGFFLAKRFPDLIPLLNNIGPRPASPAAPPGPSAPPAPLAEQVLHQLVAEKLGLQVQAPAPGVPTSVGTTVPVDLHVTTTAVPRASAPPAANR